MDAPRSIIIYCKKVMMVDLTMKFVSTEVFKSHWKFAFWPVVPSCPKGPFEAIIGFALLASLTLSRCHLIKTHGSILMQSTDFFFFKLQALGKTSLVWHWTRYIINLRANPAGPYSPIDPKNERKTKLHLWT